MPAQMQTDLVGEIRDVVGEYRKDPSGLVKFGMKCGVALNERPIAGGIMHAPKHSSETFKIDDPAFQGKHATDKDAFFAAFDSFTSNGAFLAWDGQVPDPSFQPIKEMSENHSLPTMMVELVYRRRGSSQEKKLSMFFIGFSDTATAEAYGVRHTGAVVSNRPFRGRFRDWY